jgi:hypothetical protein
LAGRLASHCRAHRGVGGIEVGLDAARQLRERHGTPAVELDHRALVPEGS